MIQIDFKHNGTPVKSGSKLLFMGSCFSENISSLLQEDKINVLANPFGVIFHPMPMLNLLDRAIQDKWFNEDEFFLWDNYWFCYDFHSELADIDLTSSVENANKQLSLLKQYLLTSEVIFLTFGSFWGYEKEGEIVANCHQQNASNFQKKLGEIELVKNSYTQFFRTVQDLNPHLQIIFTVSPVRHFKDGVVENQQSKSMLNLLCHELTQNIKKSSYFPVYELVIDILRDYSFFKKDGLHPNEKCIELVYEWFKEVFFDTDLKIRTKEWDTIKQGLKHKSIRPKSNSHQVFIKKQVQNLLEFSTKYQLNCDEEIKMLQNR